MGNPAGRQRWQLNLGLLSQSQYANIITVMLQFLLFNRRGAATIPRYCADTSVSFKTGVAIDTATHRFMSAYVVSP